METAIISRFESSEWGTFSAFYSSKFNCFVVERPWLENKKQVSCIPAGVYTCKWIKSPKFGWCYEVTNVPNRGNILIHSGNYPTHSHGCLLLATKLGIMDGKKAGLLSRPAILAFHKAFNQETFKLEIRDDYLNTSPL